MPIAIIAFLAGVLWTVVAFAFVMCFADKASIVHETPGDLFEDEQLSEEDDQDDFRVFLVSRLAESPAFRAKMIRGMAKLHETYPRIYAEVMRK